MPVKRENVFPLQIEGINTFGNKQSPRIFWASLQHEEQLHQLQAVIAKQCTEAGFSLEDRSYNPHITLARQWKGWNLSPNDCKDLILSEKSHFRFKHRKSFYIRTNLEKTPKYESIATFSLVNE